MNRRPQAGFRPEQPAPARSRRREEAESSGTSKPSASLPRRLPYLAPLFAIAWLVSAVTSVAAPLPKVSDADFKGAGVCQFATHGFALTAATDSAVNHSVRQLIERHRAVFGFQTRPDFRVRLRIFGGYADYTNATYSLYWTNAADRRSLAGRPFNVAGFYTPATKEIVTWRQQMAGFLGTTLLHEAGHAIMDAHYDNVPMWLMEGSADYFAYVLHPPGEVQQQLIRQRWMKLAEWRRTKTLPPLAQLLDVDALAFRAMESEKAYGTSWSLFQMLMSTPAYRQTVVTLLNERQVVRGPDSPEPCSRQIERLHPGGVAKLEIAWHAWIASGSRATNALPLRPAVR